MKDYIEIGGRRYAVEYRVVLVPNFDGKPEREVVPVLAEIPFNSYSDDKGDIKKDPTEVES